ncbi:MAG: YhfC family glutamic-type intramembrane protease [Eubacteriales bacterium]|nr:YhfC family glutamic-type intramembrane protease [Eubacteriales bacterium]
MVPVLSIVFMVISGMISFGLPIALCIYLYKSKKADLLPFFVGCAVMLLFAFVLESAAHRMILGSPAGEVIKGSSLLYPLYGGLMAGLFEETGRFAAFKTVLRRNRERNVNALMYGAGHGGFEAIVILGITSINNIIYSVLINSGNTAALTGSLSGDTLAQTETAIQTLISTPSWMFLLGAAERIFAIILHLSFSVLVWAAANRKGMAKMYPIAVLFHMIVDAVTVFLSLKSVSVILIEVIVGILTLAAALYVRTVCERCQRDGSFDTCE